MNTLEVGTDNLVSGRRYSVTRRDHRGIKETFNGTFQSFNPMFGQIVFGNIPNRGILSFPADNIISVNVAVSPLLPADLNEKINEFTGGKSRRNRKSMRKRKSIRRR